MIVDEDHGVVGVGHAPALVVYPSQLSELVAPDAVSHLQASNV
jgi:hypothetical protein